MASLTAINKVLVGLNDVFEKVRNQPHQTGTAKGKEEQMDAVLLGHRISQTIDDVKEVVPIIENLGVMTAKALGTVRKGLPARRNRKANAGYGHGRHAY